MNLTEFAIENKVVTLFTIVLLSLAGTFSFFSLGLLEDPEFTVKNALILTIYNGATAQEVEQEVTDRTENALQEQPELSSLHSRSTPGFSLIKVEIKQEYWADRLPQVWDKLRRKIGDVQRELPYGVSETQVVDDFGDVYGLMLGITGDEFAQITLPTGYELVWFGEHKNTIDSQASLIPGVVPALAIILFILVALFNEIRPMLIIMLIIPFVMIGVSFGLQVSGAAFGFVTLLGVMSLSGMMIKNAIVLVDQINIEKLAGKSPYQAIVDATISRIRPVFLAAATTVLGVIPLVPDVFWQGLAIAIMAGLTFGTLLTMILLPVLYSIFYQADPSKKVESKSI